MLTNMWLCNSCTFATRPIKVLFSYFETSNAGVRLCEVLVENIFTAPNRVKDPLISDQKCLRFTILQNVNSAFLQAVYVRKVCTANLHRLHTFAYTTHTRTAALYPFFHFLDAANALASGVFSTRS